MNYFTCEIDESHSNDANLDEIDWHDDSGNLFIINKFLCDCETDNETKY